MKRRNPEYEALRKMALWERGRALRAKYKAGDIVRFGEYKLRASLARIIRVNQKTVTLQALEPHNGREAGSEWRVSAGYIQELLSSEEGKKAVKEALEKHPPKRIDTSGWRIGARVQFEGRRGRIVQGVISRFNRKTVSVRADDGTDWRVGFRHLQTI